MDKFLIKTEFLEKTLPVVGVSLGGYIDQSNANKIQKVFDNLYLSRQFHLIFDFNNVIYISSAGWGIFVGEVKRFRESGGDIKIANMSADIYEIFRMLEFYHILEDYNSLEEALEAYGIVVEKKEPGNGKPDGAATEEDSKAAEAKDIVESAPFTEKGDEIPAKIETDVSDSHKDIPFTPRPIILGEVKKEVPKYDQQQVKEIDEILDITLLPIQEKIRKIVSQFPLISIRHMQKMLKYKDFGSERVGILRLYRLLKSLNLETRAKRYRYYRSC